jgi:membrane protease YdiL (CAAX protease family)
LAQLPPIGDPPAPGSQHPASPPRPVASLGGRAAPRLYAAGWVLSLAGLAALLAIIAVAAAGWAPDLDLWIRAGLVEGSLVALGAGLGAAALAQSHQRREDGWQDYFGPSPLLVTGVMLALSTAAALPLAGALAWLDIKLASSVDLLVALLVNFACYVVLTQWLAVRTGALTWGDIARPRHLAPDRGELLESFWNAHRPAVAARRLRSAVGDVGLGLGLAIPAMIGSLILAAILVALLNVQDAQTSGDTYQIVTTWDLWIVLFALAVVAPIGEEILFRGFITNAWARSLPRNSALLRGTLLFASVHIINVFDANGLDLTIRLAILAVAVRLPVAWLLGWVYTSRRSIIASVALHGSYNGALVLIAWWVVNRSY